MPVANVLFLQVRWDEERGERYKQLSPSRRTGSEEYYAARLRRVRTRLRKRLSKYSKSSQGSLVPRLAIGLVAWYT